MTLSTMGNAKMSGWILMIVAAVLVAGFFVMSQTRADEASREARGWELIAQGALLVDVRSQAEFDTGHLEGALLIPHTDVAARLSEFGSDKSRPIVLYCRSGNRAGKAEEVLAAHGFTNIHNAGGYEALMKVKP